MTLRLVTIIAVILPAIISLSAGNRYGSALLRQLSDAAGLKKVTDTLPNGVYDNLAYKGRPVRAIVKDSAVTNLGLALFTPEKRNNMPAVAVDFVERYLLQAVTGIHRASTFARQMEEDGVRFDIGDYRKMIQCLPDTSMSVTLENTSNKSYTLCLISGGLPVCSMTFPVDCHLLLGADIGELQLNLVDRLRSLPTDYTVDTIPQATADVEQLFEPEFYVARGTSFTLDALNSNRYYRRLENRSYELVFSMSHPEWSLANLFTTNSIANRIMVEVKVMMYDFSTAEVSVPLTSLLRFFKKNGFVTYFGMIDIDESNHLSEILLENRQYGFCHIMRISGKMDMISKGTDTMKARMNCYIPISKIKTLFEEKTP